MDPTPVAWSSGLFSVLVLVDSLVAFGMLSPCYLKPRSSVLVLFFSLRVFTFHFLHSLHLLLLLFFLRSVDTLPFMWKKSIRWLQQQQWCINLRIFTILGPASLLRSRIMQLWVSSLECPCESHPLGGSSTLMYLKLDSLLLIPPQNSSVFSCISWSSGFLTFPVSPARHGRVITDVSLALSVGH